MFRAQERQTPEVINQQEIMLKFAREKEREREREIG